MLIPQPPLTYRRVIAQLQYGQTVDIFLSRTYRRVHETHVFVSNSDCVTSCWCDCQICRWFLTNKFIYIMHLCIGICCAIAIWAALCLFALRLVRALNSGKRWSPRRRAMCAYTGVLVVIQVTCDLGAKHSVVTP